MEDTPVRSFNLTLKRVIDIVGAVAGLTLLAPLLIIVALVIKATSPGPVFFRQDREGLDGKSFQVLKFRSMRVDSCDISGIAQTVQNDARLTPVGRFIRKTSIDELPQLVNVLVGDMSLVGPRPHVPGMLAGGQAYRDLVPYYGDRLAMRPGITGWAQANGLRGPTHDNRLARERVDHDLAYIQNFSIWLDMNILVRTLVREFVTGSGH
ncbi:sugar transferase [Devosia sp. CAU 1758]